MEEHTVTFTLDNTQRELAADGGPETRVQPNDRVKWDCKAGDLTIQFEGNSPFAAPFDAPKTRLSISGSAQSFEVRNRRLNRSGLDPCRYTVTVDFGDGNSVEQDPVIIVEDG